jgi:hypothetical protein
MKSGYSISIVSILLWAIYYYLTYNGEHLYSNHYIVKNIDVGEKFITLDLKYKGILNFFIHRNNPVIKNL